MGRGSAGLRSTDLARGCEPAKGFAQDGKGTTSALLKCHSGHGLLVTNSIFQFILDFSAKGLVRVRVQGPELVAVFPATSTGGGLGSATLHNRFDSIFYLQALVFRTGRENNLKGQDECNILSQI